MSMTLCHTVCRTPAAGDSCSCSVFAERVRFGRLNQAWGPSGGVHSNFKREAPLLPVLVAEVQLWHEQLLLRDPIFVRVTFSGNQLQPVQPGCLDD